MQFSPEDLIELKQRELTPVSLLAQIHRFTHEIRPIRLEYPCSPSDGVIRFDATECLKMLTYFDRQVHHLAMMKFVPASGAASRMFKHLFSYSPEGVSQLTESFILNFSRFPFVQELSAKLREQGISLEQLKEENRWGEIFEHILGPAGLNYSDCPKGLVTFHNYNGKPRTAFEEQIREGLAYARNKDGSCEIHFTLAPDHANQVLEYLHQKIALDFPYEDIRISQSEQSKASETIALDVHNEPARDNEGRLIFRPAGHGALIENLEKCKADLIYIKNIDNVTAEDQCDDSVFYKKVLGGLLISLKSQTDVLLNRIEKNDKNAAEDALDFVQHWFQPGLPLDMTSQQLSEYARLRLDRPIRVCGMVRNDGEPGGGPFWVRMPDGHISKQIVEKSQVDLNDLPQSKILSEATHFNPVDIVCSIKNRRGENYKLEQFVDHSTGFVSEKFHHGKVIRALELPGLWNGAMALWNTVFVEVPSSTFHPVKTVNDLLRPGHIIQ